MDPGDLARSDPAALAQAVKEAKPFLGFRLHRLLGGANLSTAEGRARAAEAAVKVIAEHPSQLVRDQYLMEVADRCRIDIDSLRNLKTTPAPARPVTTTASSRRVETPATVVLRLAVQQPERVGDLLHESLFV